VFQPAIQRDKKNSPLQQSKRAKIDILLIILTRTKGSVLDPRYPTTEEAYWATMSDPVNPTNNNNNQQPSGRYNTRSRSSLSSQSQPNAQDTLCALCAMQHPPGDCPTVMDIPPSPIRRVAQVQQQVEQAIEQELDTLHVFDDAVLPTAQGYQCVLPNSFGAEQQATAQAQAPQFEGETASIPPNVPVARAHSQEHGRDERGDVTDDTPDTGTWVQRRGVTMRMRQQDFRTEAILQQLSQQLSAFTARYDDDRTRMDNFTARYNDDCTRMDNFITATDANFSNIHWEQATSKEDMVTFNNNL
jgi:hypothetical protein